MLLFLFEWEEIVIVFEDEYSSIQRIPVAK